ncbi:minor capsid protein [Microbacterium sp.]|uniref:minor capsid protein n=1 Tax=Microbacterium sp. TaxID=51671 RepID=UPI003F70637A
MDDEDDVLLTKTVLGFLGEIEGWQWDEDVEDYPDDVVGGFYGAIRSKPDRAFGVRVYMTEDDRINYLHWRRVQLRLRGAQYRPDGADELASAAYRRLQGLSRVGGISGISRLSMAPLGADTNGREERTENYLIILDNQEA